MRDYNWEFDFDSTFPIHVFNYTVFGHRDQLHWHRYYEIGLVEEGTGTFQYVGKSFPSCAGDIFVTNNYESHVAVTDNPLQNYTFLIMLPNFISNNSIHVINQQYLSTFQYNPLHFINRIPAQTEAAQTIGSLMRQARAFYQKQDTAWQLEVDILTRSILLELYQYYSKNRNKDVASLISNPKMRLAQQYISNNYNRALTVNEVAGYVDMSPSYFRHVFKETIQISFKEYITQLRLARACTLLQSTDHTINDIIEEVGYSNFSQFYRVFRKYYNATPAEYRDQNLDM